MLLRLALLCLVFALPARAEEVVAGLSQNRVSITANFDGSEILIFGAVKRETPMPEGPLEVIITVTGPSEPVTVRRKDRRYGIWVNVDSVIVDQAPSFYAVASTNPLADVLSDVADLEYRISIERAIHAVGTAFSTGNPKDFSDAIIRIRREKGLYQLLEDGVNLAEDTLFSTSISLPANLIEGDYTAHIYLTRDGKVIDAFDTSIDVSKVGLERWIYNLAHERPLIYGLFSLFIAITAGWSASAVFRYIRT